MRTIRVLILKEDEASTLPLPAYMTPGASGLDLYSAEKSPVILQPGKVELINTGLRLSIPDGFEAQIRPRSGMALKHSIGVLNSPGTIDSDYRGLIKIILMNFGAESFEVVFGMRIAQMVFQEIIKADIEVVDSLDETQRASGGFGHTGLKND